MLNLKVFVLASGSLFAFMGCSAFTPSAAPPQCLADTDCSNGRICAQELCVVACRIDAECGEGLRCVFSQCEPLPATPRDAGPLADEGTADMSPDMTGLDMQTDGTVNDMAAGDMAAADMTTGDMAAADMTAGDMAPTADMAAGDMAPAADMAAGDMAAAADMTAADAQ